MRASQRIFLNTSASYARTIISIILVLFSTRWILGSLGKSDFGIFSLVGSLLIFISFFNNVLATADSRFFALELGRQNNSLSDLFKSATIIHLVVPIILITFGCILGVYAIRHLLNIPQDRINATLIVFYYSLVVFFFNMISVPYKALFIANQDIVSISILEIFQAILIFLSAYILRFSDGDLLVRYALYYSISQLIVCILFVILAIKKYPDHAHPSKGKSDKGMMKSLLKYSFWSSFGDLGHLFRTQGIVIVVNLLFSTVGNAALGIANQVSAQASNLSNSLMKAVSPEIFRRIGAGQTESGIALSETVSKIAVLLMLILGIPIIINIDGILHLWLEDVPQYTAILCKCFIVMFIIERFTMGQTIMLSALNKIAGMQVCVCLSYTLAVILPYCGLCRYFGIMGIGLSCIISMTISRICINIIYAKTLKVGKELRFIRFVCSSCILTIVLILLFNFIFGELAEGWMDMIIYCGIIALVTLAAYTLLTFSRQEIKTICNIFKR